MFYRLRRKWRESFARGKNKPKAKFSFCHYSPAPSLFFFFFFQVPYCDFDKWQCKKRIYVGSRRLAHYHKQNRALGLRHRGAIEKVFGCDAWVKTHFWKWECCCAGTSLQSCPWRARWRHCGLDEEERLARKLILERKGGTRWLPEDLRAEWFKATCRKCLWLYCFSLPSFQGNNEKGKKKKKRRAQHKPSTVLGSSESFRRNSVPSFV